MAIKQCDVKNVYLNACLKPGIDLYMELPPLYRDFQKLPSKLENEPCATSKLLVPLYGTKQGAHDWYQKVKEMFLQLDYRMSQANEAVFFKIEKTKFTIVASTTDDFTIITESPESAALIKTQLKEFLEVVNLGEINWLLRVKITQD